MAKTTLATMPEDVAAGCCLGAGRADLGQAMLDAGPEGATLDALGRALEAAGRPMPASTRRLAARAFLAAGLATSRPGPARPGKSGRRPAVYSATSALADALDSVTLGAALAAHARAVGATIARAEAVREANAARMTDEERADAAHVRRLAETRRTIRRKRHVIGPRDVAAIASDARAREAERRAERMGAAVPDVPAALAAAWAAQDAAELDAELEAYAAAALAEHEAAAVTWGTVDPGQPKAAPRPLDAAGIIAAAEDLAATVQLAPAPQTAEAEPAVMPDPAAALEAADLAAGAAERAVVWPSAARGWHACHGGHTYTGERCPTCSTGEASPARLAELVAEGRLPDLPGRAGELRQRHAPMPRWPVLPGGRGTEAELSGPRVEALAALGDLAELRAAVGLRERQQAGRPALRVVDADGAT